MHQAIPYPTHPTTLHTTTVNFFFSVTEQEQTLRQSPCVVTTDKVHQTHHKHRNNNNNSSTIVTTTTATMVQELQMDSAHRHSNYEGIDLGEGRLEFPKRITASPDGRAWFARGWLQTLNYNHEEAMACFERSLEADKTCMMALWGIGELYSSLYRGANNWLLHGTTVVTCKEQAANSSSNNSSSSSVPFSRQSSIIGVDDRHTAIDYFVSLVRVQPVAACCQQHWKKKSARSTNRVCFVPTICVVGRASNTHVPLLLLLCTGCDGRRSRGPAIRSC